MSQQPLPQRPQVPPHQQPAPSWPIHPALVTAGLEIPGFKIAYAMGIVRGLTVRAASAAANVAATFKSIAGGQVTSMIYVCEQARATAFSNMVQEAAQLGANAIISFRYDATELSPGLTEVLAYGTAVWADPEGQ